MRNRKLLIFLFALLFLFGTVSIYKRRYTDIKGVSTKIEKQVAGIILPHHDVAASLLDTSYKKLATQAKYSTIVIIGPNHFSPNSGFFTTTTTLFTDIKISKSMNKLIQIVSDLHVSKDIIQKDHAIMIHLPYIKENFPDASIVPILVSPLTTLSETRKFSDSISSLFPKDTLYIASVDFSHDSTIEEGIRNNTETISAIQKFDLKTLLSFTDKHLDSPNGISLWLHVLRSKNITGWELWDSTHSGYFLSDPRTRGTSYVAGVFYR